MEPLTNKPTNQELIEIIERNLLGMIGIIIPERFNEFYELLNRFKSLTENRSEMVEKCVEAVMIALETANMDTYINSTPRDRIKSALTKLLEK